MPARPRRKNAPSLIAKAAELAFAAPQVVAHRVARMAMAGPVLSERDRREFRLMGAEKTAAFSEAWNAMAAHAFRANQALAVSFAQSLWSPSPKGRPSATEMAVQLQDAALGMLDKGMDPVHRKAVANAKRLARTRLR